MTPTEANTPTSFSDNSSQSDEDVQPSTSRSSSQSHKKKHKKEHKKKHKSKKDKPKVAVEVMEFDGTEEFYVDKTAERGYLRVQTLYKPACPR